MIKRILKFVLRLVWVGVTIILLVFLIPYLTCPVYRFPAEEAFSGKEWYNPYETLDAEWLKAVFHAHTAAWGALTVDQGTPEDLGRVYRDMGYDIASISNYQQIMPDARHSDTYIPAYEHGYNFRKTHQLVIGARKVVKKDYIFLQSVHTKQNILNSLKSDSELVALAHPTIRHSYKPKFMSRLSGYDLIEVYSRHHYAGPLWDMALSAGHPIWGLGSEDVHNVNNPTEAGNVWNMVHAKSKDPESVYEALRTGRSYLIRGQNGHSDLSLESLEVHGDSLLLRLSKPAQIRFIGQEGIVRKSVLNSSQASLKLEYNDTYIRTEIEDGQSIMVLNPVIRYDGTSLPFKTAEINWFLTLIYRALFLTIPALFIYIILTTLLSRRKRAMT
jgi:hypothetical protein